MNHRTDFLTESHWLFCVMPDVWAGAVSFLFFISGTGLLAVPAIDRNLLAGWTAFACILTLAVYADFRRHGTRVPLDVMTWATVAAGISAMIGIWGLASGILGPGVPYVWFAFSLQSALLVSYARRGIFPVLPFLWGCAVAVLIIRDRAAWHTVYGMYFPLSLAERLLRSLVPSSVKRLEAVIIASAFPCLMGILYLSGVIR